ncbi:hypothetical protein YYG_03654 [Plasmodium vinckei petteri]|uniref:Uncharacterized protein n=2 Tax=Plasmodium vinckei TaxID=5860 RepID=W7AIG0_PLAVN|nr:hypothetical protein YYG_03654 [Plasmodium vinckei petteri]CAD2088198.1 conserved Plasmodium protein, unknown function [Plasmodium vinckei lentum]CAD2100232.1 conserved Plasmodium protein, unknown function [Plasmodium vinckei petteri]
MSKENKFRDECLDYRRAQNYNPKVHVSGWYDIQNDDDYIEKYNKTKEFYIKEYPLNPREGKYQNMSKCRKNISDKETIFYQDHDTSYWETENKRSYKK